MEREEIFARKLTRMKVTQNPHRIMTHDHRVLVDMIERAHVADRPTQVVRRLGVIEVHAMENRAIAGHVMEAPAIEILGGSLLVVPLTQDVGGPRRTGIARRAIVLDRTGGLSEQAAVMTMRVIGIARVVPAGNSEIPLIGAVGDIEQVAIAVPQVSPMGAESGTHVVHVRIPVGVLMIAVSAVIRGETTVIVRGNHDLHEATSDGTTAVIEVRAEITPGGVTMTVTVAGALRAGMSRETQHLGVAQVAMMTVAGIGVAMMTVAEIRADHMIADETRVSSAAVLPGRVPGPQRVEANSAAILQRVMTSEKKTEIFAQG
jgi:hypothetical protein